MATEWKSIDGNVVTSTEFSTRQGSMYEVAFNYEVDGKWFGGTINTSTAYQPGDVMVVEYDPTNPERNKLMETQRLTRWIVVAVIIVMLTVLIYFRFTSR